MVAILKLLTIIGVLIPVPLTMAFPNIDFGPQPNPESKTMCTEGETIVNSCETCTCTSGQLNCEPINACEMALCVDSVLEGCCFICPNGNNCETWDGTKINDGEVINVDGQDCMCDFYNYDRAAFCF